MKRSTKRRLVVWGVNLSVLAVVVALLLLIDWPNFRANFWNPGGVSGDQSNWGGDLITIGGAVNTVKYTAIAFAGGLAFAVVLSLMRLSPIATLRWLATAYVEFFRGLPALLVIIFMGFGLPIAIGWSPPGGRRRSRAPRPDHGRQRLHGRDPARRNPGRTQGTDRGGTLARDGGR